MNLKSAIDMVGTQLGYSPSSSTYRDDLAAAIDAAQLELCSRSAWDWMTSITQYVPRADESKTVGVTSGSLSVTGTGFPYSSTVGSLWDGETIVLEGVEYQIAWVSSTTNLYLTQTYAGTTNASASAVVRSWNIRLPRNTVSVQSIVGQGLGLINPTQSDYAARYQAGLDEQHTRERGNPSTWYSMEPFIVPAPRKSTGISVYTTTPGRGVRTVQVFLVNVWGRRCAAGFTDCESAPGTIETFDLQDDEDLHLTPETLSNQSGLYRRYYIIAPSIGIHAPRLLRDASTAVSTVAPTGGVTLNPNTALSTLTSQSWETDSVRYIGGGEFLRIRFAPHPQDGRVYELRRLTRAPILQEDQDTLVVPGAQAMAVVHLACRNMAVRLNRPDEARVWEQSYNQVLKALYARQSDQAQVPLVIGSNNLDRHQTFYYFTN